MAHGSCLLNEVPNHPHSRSRSSRTTPATDTARGVVVLPITSNVESLYPGEASVEVKGKQGRALGDQIRSIDKSRLKARAGRLTAEEMSRAEEALAITLDLPI
jgi:mRNA-degrading endonuclease toxin of MazEF toxin-antitoxin module